MVSLGINTVMYLDALQQGTPQSALLEGIATHFPVAEVRREFIAGGNETDPAFADEIEAIRHGVRMFNLRLYYSVPEDFCTDGKVNPNLERYLREANEMTAQGMKFAVGDVPNTPLETLREAAALIDRYGVSVTVENDQSATHGSLEWALASMRRLREADASAIGFCYDCGNWAWAGVNPDDAFDALMDIEAIGEYQIKNVRFEGGAGGAEDGGEGAHPTPSLLNDGVVDWAAQVRRLPADVPVTLEYPAPIERIDDEVATAKRALA
ncbi:AP endonuclease [Bifidobacterium sp. DSM 109958]|uniref:AP endonuclease n=1 Tax=Bifidobacterium moraviense TaxID=2675323 RepID=A0A7Y0HZJ0_9BIFI|nr:TIM barrel protein [Bifidobacterium sp. DSM 109958]NMN00864.1 AP endonuclease [Bifidobacterium sp. DSM 109958]